MDTSWYPTSFSVLASLLRAQGAASSMYAGLCLSAERPALYMASRAPLVPPGQAGGPVLTAELLIRALQTAS